MNFKDHLRYGVVAGSIVATTSHFLIADDLRVTVSMGLSTIIGSLVSDIDTESIPSKVVGRILFFYLLMSLLKDNISFDHWILNIKIPAWCAVIFLGFKLDSHRGFTHKYIFPLSFIGIMFYTQYLWFGSFAFGMIVHYIIDKIYPWKLRSWI